MLPDLLSLCITTQIYIVRPQVYTKCNGVTVDEVVPRELNEIPHFTLIMNANAAKRIVWVDCGCSFVVRGDERCDADHNGLCGRRGNTSHP